VIAANALPLPLLLTATVAPPPGVPFLTRSDPAVRLADYAAALRLYLALPNALVDRIVVADNSASDLSALDDLARRAARGKDVELLSFEGRPYPVERGRSVGETYLIDDALTRSRILTALDDDELFWKVTGRLRVANLGRLIASTPRCALYIDFRRYRRPWVDTRVFAATPAGFRAAFLPRLDILRQDLLPPNVVAPEERLFEELLPEVERLRIAPRLRVEPKIEGRSGLGEDYRRPRRRVESAVRRVTRRLVPALWI
jgi:hypothetical protein